MDTRPNADPSKRDRTAQMSPWLLGPGLSDAIIYDAAGTPIAIMDARTRERRPIAEAPAGPKRTIRPPVFLCRRTHGPGGGRSVVSREEEP